MYENKVLRRLFGPGRKAVTEEWTKLLNEGFIMMTVSAMRSTR
jgi:hypothetical protein